VPRWAGACRRTAGANHLPGLVSKAYSSRIGMEVDHEPNRSGLIADERCGGPGAGEPRLVLRGGRAECVGQRDSSTTAAEWHPQQLTLNYSGFTTLYSCDGIEHKVREILLTFGARKDLTVRATGCNEGRAGRAVLPGCVLSSTRWRRPRIPEPPRRSNRPGPKYRLRRTGPISWVRGSASWWSR